MPRSSATATTPPIGWRINRMPMTRLRTPISAARPRLSVLRLSAATSATSPSITTKIPVITAIVARLSPGRARTTTPAITLNTPSPSVSHQSPDTSRSRSRYVDISDIANPFLVRRRESFRPRRSGWLALIDLIGESAVRGGCLEPTGAGWQLWSAVVAARLRRLVARREGLRHAGHGESRLWRLLRHAATTA